MKYKITKVIATTLFLSATSLFSMVNAGVISTGVFTGELYEGFETYQVPGLDSAPFVGFDGQAIFSITGGGNYHTTGTWGGGECGCASGPVEGSYIGSYINGSGEMEITFNESLSSFGGYFNSLFTTTSSTISFFDEGNLIAQDDVTVGYEDYNWQGWESISGSKFDSVVITHMSSSNYSFLIFDALQANKAAVPEPSTLAVLGLGLIGMVLRKVKKS